MAQEKGKVHPVTYEQIGNVLLFTAVVATLWGSSIYWWGKAFPDKSRISCQVLQSGQMVVCDGFWYTINPGVSTTIETIFI